MFGLVLGIKLLKGRYFSILVGEWIRILLVVLIGVGVVFLVEGCFFVVIIILIF